MKKQHGLSFLGVMIMLLALGLLIKIGIALFSAYYDDRLINQQIQDILKNSSGSMSADDFKKDLDKRLVLNNIHDLHVDDIVKVDVQSSGLKVHKSYQRSAPFFKNTQLVTTFNEDFNQSTSNVP